MKLLSKFNGIMIITLIVGLGVTGLYAYKLTRANVLILVTGQAELVMQQAMAVRSYSDKEVLPLTKGDSSIFHPQAIPSYAATTISDIMKNSYPKISYKEAVFNPTNNRDKASLKEEEIIKKFIADPGLKKQVGSMEGKSGTLFYLAYPIKITDPSCLSCHGIASAAPASMVNSYGDKGGFGWKLNEIVGTRIVSVPYALPGNLAKSTFLRFIVSLALTFLALFVVLNYMIRTIVINPVSDLTRLADDLSRGKTNTEELIVKGKDEISNLTVSFNRMRRSVLKVLELID